MAVYTEVPAQELDDFLTQYDIGRAVSLKGIQSGIENSNYFLATEQGRFILTLYEKRVNPAELPYFLNLMTHLRKKDVICPLPVSGKDGNALRDLCGKKAAVTTFLEGASAMRIRAEHCAELGRAMAGMHLAGQDYPGYRKNDLSLEGWKSLMARIGPAADTVADGLYKEMCADLEEIGKNFPDGLPRGVIHADLFPDNVFFTGKNLSGIIDFYFACNDALVYELAVCLNAWCFEPGTWELNTTNAARMLAAYNKVRPLSPEEKEALPLFARGSALRFLLTRTYDWLNRVDGALVTPKNPMEYVKKLRFHRGIKAYHEYGLYA